MRRSTARRIGWFLWGAALGAHSTGVSWLWWVWYAVAWTVVTLAYYRSHHHNGNGAHS